jgi:membrane protein DedA with SNARE-associated domain
MDRTISDALLNLFPATGYAGTIIGMAIERCCIPLPSELIMPLAGFLAFRKRFNSGGTAFAGAVGCVAGSAVASWIGAVSTVFAGGVIRLPGRRQARIVAGSASS